MEIAVRRLLQKIKSFFFSRELITKKIKLLLKLISEKRIISFKWKREVVFKKNKSF